MQKTVEAMTNRMVRRHKSPQTIKTYRVAIKGFCSFINLEPDSAVVRALNDSDWLGASLESWMDELSSRNRSMKTVLSYVSAVKKWLRVAGVKFDWDSLDLPKVEVKNEDRAPTIEELRSLLKFADPRMKAIISVLISSGVRIGTLLNSKWKDLDFTADPDGFVIFTVKKRAQKGSMVLYGKPEGEKTAYYTFLTPEARGYLLQYAKSFGITEGDLITRLNPKFLDWPIIQKIKQGPGRVEYNNLSKEWLVLLDELGIIDRAGNSDTSKRYEIRLHCLRKYFRTRLGYAEGAKESLIKRWMGHQAGIEDPLDSAYWRGQMLEDLQYYKTWSKQLMVGEEYEVETLDKKVNELQRELESLRVVAASLKDLKEEIEEMRGKAS